MTRPGSPDTPAAAPPAPRHAGWIATGVHLVATLILAWPAFSGQLLLNPRSDQYKAGFAFRDFARQYFAEHGAIPQWSPWLFGGMPFVDAMHGDTFYPTALLRLLLGTGPGMTWGLILHLFLAGLFTYLLLRALRLSFHAAMVGGVAYQMSGNIAGLVSPGHDGKIFVATMLPLALLLLVRGIRDGRAWAWGPLALVTGLAVLSPHPQLLQYMLLLCGAFALFLWRGWGSAPDDPAGARDPKRLGLALAAIATGMLMGAIQFWPVVTYTPWSPRDGGLGWEHAVSFSLPPEELVNFALPQFTGMLDAYWGRNNIHLHSDYIGIAVLLLAAAAFGSWAQGPLRRVRWFLTGAFVVSLLWAMGGYTPFYNLVYAIVPGTKFFRAPSTMLFIVNFTLACLAALGAERVLRGAQPTRALAVAGGVTLLLGLFAITGGLTNSALAIAGSERAQFVIENEPALRSGAVRMLAMGALMALAIVLVARRRLSRDLAGALLIGIVAVDLWSILRRYFMFMPPAAETFASDDAIAWLQKQPGPFRVIPLPPRQGAGHDQYLQALNYDGLMTHRVPVAMGYHGNHIGKYDLLLGPDYSQLGNPNFWRLANTRYFLTDEAKLPIDSAKTVFGPVTNMHGHQVWVHQVPVTTSYAWTTTALLRADEQRAAQTVLDPGFDVRTVAIFDTSARVDAAELRAVPAPSTLGARTTAWSPGSATIELDAPAVAGSALVVSENYYPGWRASVDGRPVAVHRANVSLIGIPLPAGARRVELTFVNEPYTTGRLVTWLAVAAALIAWLVGWRRSKGAAHA